MTIILTPAQFARLKKTSRQAAYEAIRQGKCAEVWNTPAGILVCLHITSEQTFNQIANTLRESLKEELKQKGHKQTQ